PETPVGETVGKVVAYLSWTSMGATIGKIVARLPAVPVGATIGKVTAHLSRTSVGAMIGKAVAHLPATWVGATFGAVCGTATGLLLHRVLLRRTVVAVSVEGAPVQAVSAESTSVDTKDETPFLHACRTGNIGDARQLYASKKPSRADVSKACFSAAGKGHENIVSWLIASCKVKADQPDKSGNTVLMVASARGHLETVRSLIREGASIDKQNKQNRNITALGCACMNGHTDVAQLLYDEAMARKGRVEGMGPALEGAARKGQTEAVRWLVDRFGAKLSGVHGEVALRIASMLGHKDIVQLLLADEDLCVDKRGHGDWTAFLLACDDGYTDIARLLYERDRNVTTATTENGDTALMCATRKGQTEVARWLIEICHGDPLLRENDRGWSAFHHACVGGHMDIIERLFSYVKNPVFAISRADKHDCTLFGSVAYVGRVEVIRLFLRTDPTLGGIVKRCTAQGWPPLVLASKQGHPEVVKLLLDAGAPVNDTIEGWQGETALTYAAQAGNMETVELLIRRGADVDPYPMHSEGNAPIIHAAEGGHTAVVQLLRDHGADIRRTGHKGCTALSRAEAGEHAETATLIRKLLAEDAVGKDRTEGLREAGLSGNTDTARQLLDAGVDVDAADPTTGKTTLMLAAENGRTEFVRWLLNGSFGVDITRSDKNGDTVLILAIKGGHKDIVKLFVRADAGALLLRRNYLGWTALMYAIEGRDGDIIASVLSAIREMRTTPDETDRAGTVGITSLMTEIGSRAGRMSRDDLNETLIRAAGEGCADSVRLLIRLGADVNHRDTERNTPAILAASRGYEAIVRLLFEAGGADPTLRNRSGQTASSSARAHGYDPVAKLIDELLAGKRSQPPSLFGKLRQAFKR
ncbi:MAG: ankyrin repeat domain-containing protein, partial [Simkaniaceae bacterium]|nr:ankyrin repeat domain-containing protein [Simkaniaceae bacterium]